MCLLNISNRNFCSDKDEISAIEVNLMLFLFHKKITNWLLSQKFRLYLSEQRLEIFKRNAKLSIILLTKVQFSNQVATNFGTSLTESYHFYECSVDSNKKLQCAYIRSIFLVFTICLIFLQIRQMKKFLKFFVISEYEKYC